MLTGTIVNKSPRGFAFIHCDETRQDYFLHVTNLVDGDFESLAIGDRVQFVAVADNRGRTAGALEAVVLA